ncbi:hypothetical protein LZ30DRAFT_718172 [Colletotrichum cereale]|nr:hypothetical protein LZ30DRAFT_718172 [Colletotrichum cereale]
MKPFRNCPAGVVSFVIAHRHCHLCASVGPIRSSFPPTVPANSPQPSQLDLIYTTYE